jgi:hypothetical protein
MGKHCRGSINTLAKAKDWAKNMKYTWKITGEHGVLLQEGEGRTLNGAKRIAIRMCWRFSKEHKICRAVVRCNGDARFDMKLEHYDESASSCFDA